MPMEMAATWPVSGRRARRPASTEAMSASCRATHAPVMDAVRVPPSAWITSQSQMTVSSPRRCRSTTARRLRPIRRSISIERPLRPLYSRRLRVLVDAGSMAYSALTQPAREPLRQAGTPSSTVAVQMTRVSPNSARHEPSAFFMMSRVSLAGRIWSAARPYERVRDGAWTVAGAGMVPPGAGLVGVGASDADILPPIRSRAPLPAEPGRSLWWAMTGSNRRPCACKAPALAAAPIARCRQSVP